MHLIKKLIFVVLLLSALIAALVVSAPLYLPTLSTKLLSAQGLAVNSIKIRLPNTHSWIIKEMQVQTTQGILIDIDTMIVRFNVPDLFRGKLDAIDIESLTTTRSNAIETASDIDDDNESLLTVKPPQQWMADFPVGRVYVRQGLIDDRITLKGLDFQVNNQGLQLDGLFNLEGQEIQVKGQISVDNIFSFLVSAGDSQFKSEGQFVDGGLTGDGSTDLDIVLFKPWLPPELQALEGELHSSIEFNFIFQADDIESDIQFKIKGKFTHPQYFDVLDLQQALIVTGPLQSPKLVISAGDALTIRKLRQPIEYDNVVIALTSDLELPNIRQNLNVEQRAALQVRSDKDEIDVVFNGSQIAVNGKIPSIRKGFYVSSDMEVLSLSPLELHILKGGQLSLGRIDQFGDVTMLFENDIDVIDSNNTVRFGKAFAVVLSSPVMQARVNVEGSLSPLALSVAAETDNLAVNQTALGKADLKLSILESKDKQQNLSASITATVAGLKIDGLASYGLQSQLGQVQLDALSLSQMSRFLSAQCIEVNAGSAKLNGTLDARSSIKLKGDFSLNNVGLVFQDTPISNINLLGGWVYDGAGSTQSTSINANLSVPKVNIGVLINDLNAELRYTGEALLIDKVQGRTLGGRLYGVNLRWYPQRPRNELQLYLDEIDLRQLVALEDYDGLTVIGKINASLPLVVDSAGVQVIGGKIESLKPGGEIHLPVDATNRTGAEKEAFEALQNFHFETLSGGISGPIALDPNGYLASNLTLRGTNPDMGRPVSLNLSIEQNTYPIFQTLELFDKINRIGQCSQ